MIHRMTCNVVKVILRVYEPKRPVWGSVGVDRGGQGVKVKDLVGLMSLLMIHKAYLPLY